jgi:hypothetical protein
VDPASDEEVNDPTRSSYDRGYWLRRCEGFLVETPTKRIGRVTGIRYGETTNEPEVLEVRAGLFGRTRLLISVHDTPRWATRKGNSICILRNSSVSTGRQSTVY